MSNDTVSKYKWFWYDQDAEQERWLTQMARQGLHLKSVAMFRWTFTKGEAADVAYRFDYSKQSENPYYKRLLEDAGWQCAATSGGWSFWRKAALAGSGGAELFTDNDAKIARFRLMLWCQLAIVPISMFNMVNGSSSIGRALATLTVALVLYTSTRLWLRIRRLKTADKI